MLIIWPVESGGMKGTFDEASLRLAKALHRPPEQVDAALADVGVDALYLSRALADGDPQGAIDAVSARLGIPQRDLVMALVRTSGGDPRAAAAANAAQAEAFQEFLDHTLPTLLSRGAYAALGLGATLAGFASLAIWQPDLFRAVLVYAAAGALALGSVLLLVAAWRMRRAALALRRRRPAPPATKR